MPHLIIFAPVIMIYCFVFSAPACLAANYVSAAKTTTASLLDAKKPSIKPYINGAMVIKSDGTLWGWGTNSEGELGDGTSIERLSPIKIGTEYNWAQIAVGCRYTIALKNDGSLWAWGNNQSGQLGDGTTIGKLSPVHIGQDTDWVQIAASNNNNNDNEDFVLALKSDGTLWAWGSNYYGQLGNDTTTYRKSPYKIGADNDWSQVSAGMYHAVALKNDGTLWSWGYNTDGEIGDGSTTARHAPVQVGLDSDWVKVQAGDYFSVAQKMDGTLWAWGYNGAGFLGNGNTDNKPYPVLVGSENSWSDFSVGMEHTIALRSDGTIWTWGWNGMAQLGDGTAESKSSPIQVGTASDWGLVAAGGFHTFAVKRDGMLWVWGANSGGQLGLGTKGAKVVPTLLNTDNNWVGVSAKLAHVVAIKRDGTLWGTGYNPRGQLGNGSDADVSVFSQIGAFTNWSQVFVGGDFTFGSKQDGTLWAWGGNENGELGDGTFLNRFSPVQVGTMSLWSSLSMGLDHSIAIKPDGTIWGWGLNDYGQLGDGTAGNKTQPVQIGINSNWAKGAAGAMHSLAVRKDGTLWAWGNNGDGELGNNTFSNSSTPLQVGNDTNWASIAAGAWHSLALKNDGSLWAWGANNYGQLGVGGTSGKTIPTKVGTETDWVWISTSEHYNVALKKDGSLWAWGQNDDAGIGDGTLIDRTTPVRIGTDTDWKKVFATQGNTIALKNNGTLWGWGSNGNGELGDGSSRQELPVPQTGIFLADWSFNVSTSSGTGGKISPASSAVPRGTTAVFRIAPDTGYAIGKIYGCAGNLSGSDYITSLIFADCTITATFEPITDVLPVVSISSPDLNSAGISLSMVTGTAIAQNGKAIAKIEVQITDGVRYVTTDGLTTTPTWLLANGVANWSLAIENDLILYKTYTISVKATDNGGGVSTISTLFTKIATLDPYPSTLSINLSTQAILSGGAVDISGKLTRQPDNGLDLTGKTIALDITDPTGNKFTPAPTTTTTSNGQYLFSGLNQFTLKGGFSFKARFAGINILAQSESFPAVLDVGSQAGYAIIIQGKIPNDEGLASHAKTTNKVYQALLERGLAKEGILYLSYQSTNEAVKNGVIVFGTPSKENFRNAITTWASGKLKGVSAPLYIVMVDHGTSGNFYIDSETVTPSELDTWLSDLETQLTGTPAAQEKRFIINGSCFSGSFIPSLSKPGRVIITSSAATEESIKGSMEPDGIRSGEYFLDELFSRLKIGYSIKRAFDESADIIRTMRTVKSSTNSISSFGDYIEQHPLLDDNSDGSGSFLLSDYSGDGSLSSNLYLGTENFTTNTALSPSEIIGWPATQFLDSGTTSALLWIKTAGSNNHIDSAWSEIHTPITTINDPGNSSGQLTVDLPKVVLMPVNLQAENDNRKFVTTPNVPSSPYNLPFDTPGTYTAYYYTRDAATGGLSPVKRSVVYKQKTGNQAPSGVDLITPKNASNQKTMVSLEWTQASDPENDPISYTLELATDNLFTTIAYKQEELLAPLTFIPEGTLKDLTTYYWRIKAIDSYGALSTSQSFSFNTDNTNGLPGLITGYIRNNTSSAVITNATVQLGSANARPVLANGAYLQMASPGASTLKVQAAGYTDKSINVTLTPGKALTASIYLTPLAATTKPGDCNSDGSVTIAEVQSAINMFLGLKTAESCVNIDNAGGVTIAEVQKVINSFLGL